MVVVGVGVGLLLLLASVGWSKCLDGADELAVLVNLDDLCLKRAGGLDEVVGLGFGCFDGGGCECGAVKTDFVGVHGSSWFVGVVCWLRVTVAPLFCVRHLQTQARR